MRIFYLKNDLAAVSRQSFYLHSTPTGCSFLTIRFSIDIAPLRGEERFEKIVL